jgi:hypothetical protein
MLHSWVRVLVVFFSWETQKPFHRFLLSCYYTVWCYLLYLLWNDFESLSVESFWD